MSLLNLLSENPLVYRLGCALVHSLWQGVLIAVALALVFRVLRDRPRPRHAAAWLALLLMGAAIPVTVWRVEPPAALPGSASTLLSSARALMDLSPGSGASKDHEAAAAHPEPVAGAVVLPEGVLLPLEAGPAPGAPAIPVP